MMFAPCHGEKLPAALVGLLLSICLTTSLATETSTSESEAAVNKPGMVADATFTTAVVDGAPTEYLSEIPNSVGEVFFYTVLEGLEGQSVLHRWSYAGKTVTNVRFEVDAPRFKAWSSHKMEPNWTGAWVVDVVDGDGNVIATETFSYLEPL